MFWQPDSPQLAGGRGGGYPPASWPSKDQLTYTKEMVTVGLLLLALPWIMSKLLTQPSAVFAGAAGKQAVAKPPAV